MNSRYDSTTPCLAGEPVQIIEVDEEGEDALDVFVSEFEPNVADAVHRNLASVASVRPFSTKSTEAVALHRNLASVTPLRPVSTKSTETVLSTRLYIAGAITLSIALVAVVLLVAAPALALPKTVDVHQFLNQDVHRFLNQIVAVAPPTVNPPPSFLHAADVASASSVPKSPVTDQKLPAPSSPNSATTDPAPTSQGATVGRPAAAAPGAASPATMESVQGLLDRYFNALAALDVDETKAIWPRVDVAALRRSFTNLDEQKFEVSDCDITASGTRAEAACSGIIRYVPRAGSKTVLVQRHRWTFQLHAGNGHWLIDDVQVHGVS